jgi:hypothetical protein
MIDLLREVLESLMAWLDVCSSVGDGACASVLITWLTLLISWLGLYA